MGNETVRYGPRFRVDNVRDRIRSHLPAAEPDSEPEVSVVRRSDHRSLAARTSVDAGNSPFPERTTGLGSGYPVSGPAVTFVQKWARRYAFAADGFAGGFPR